MKSFGVTAQLRGSLIPMLVFGSLWMGHTARAAAPPGPNRPWNSALHLSPLAKYSQASIFGQGTVPSYKGTEYGANIEYLIGPRDFSIGPYFELTSVTLDNTANNSAQKEILSGTVATPGLKIYTTYTFLKIGAPQMNFKDKATGTITNSKTFKSNGLQLGAGLNYQLSDYIAASAGLDIQYFKLDPNDNDITQRLDYMSYAFVISLRFTVPSKSAK